MIVFNDLIIGTILKAYFLHKLHSLSHLSFSQHIRSMYTYFSRSAQKKKKLGRCAQKEREILAVLVEKASELYEQYGWKLVSLKMYCPTRWTGIQQTLKSILRDWGALCVYKAVLIRDGYGYTSDHDDEDSELSLDEVEDESEEEDADRRADVRGARLLSLDNANTGKQGAAKSK